MKRSTFSLHTRGLTSDVVEALKAVVAYAERHKEKRTHCISLSEFRNLAGFPLDTTRAEIVKVMSRAGKASASVRIVEVSTLENNLIFSGNWLVFDFILITHTQISFEVCPYMWMWESFSNRV